jgi:ABC-type transport system involved in multi-copper enzyme maturation permease subunit
MFPIVQREMHVAARRRTTYGFRVLTAFVAFIVVYATWRDMQGSLSNPTGQHLLWALTVIGCVAATWQGSIRAAKTLSEERANGTLGLLFLTPLKTTDVVLGKFSTAALLALQMAMTLMPVLAISALFGGVSIGEVARAGLWVANVTFFFITASMLASAVTASEVAALALSLMFAAVVTILGLYEVRDNIVFADQHALFLNPISSSLGLADSSYSSTPHFYWNGMLVGHGAGWFMLWCTAAALKRNWQRAEVFPALKFLWTRKPKPIKRGVACKLGEAGPVEWLIVRDVYRWGPLLLVLTCIALSLPFKDTEIRVFMGIVAAIILVIGVVVHSSLAVSRAKKSGMLDLVAVAPICDEDLVADQIRGLRRLFFAPMLITVGWLSVFLPWKQIIRDFDASWWVPAYYIATIPLTLWAGSYCGIWMALKSKGPVMAVTRNAALTIVVPWILPVPAGLVLFMLGRIAQTTVRKDFRNLLAKRSQPTSFFPEIQRDTAPSNWAARPVQAGN